MSIRGAFSFIGLKGLEMSFKLRCFSWNSCSTWKPKPQSETQET